MDESIQDFAKSVIAEEGNAPEAEAPEAPAAAEPASEPAKPDVAPEPETAEVPASAPGEPTDEAQAEAPAEPEAPANNRDKKKDDGFRRRIDVLTAKQREAERQRDELARRLQAAEAVLQQQQARARQMPPQPVMPQVPGGGPVPVMPGQVPPWMQQPQFTPPVPQAPQIPPGYVRAEEVSRIAEEQRKVEDYNRRANEVHDQGVAKFGDEFKDSLAPLQEIGATNDPNFVNAAIATGAAPEVLHYLGQNFDEAMAVAQLPPAMMGVEMAKLAAKLTAKPAPSAPKPVTKAPAPVRATGGAAKPSFDPDTAPVDDPSFDKFFANSKVGKKLMGFR